MIPGCSKEYDELSIMRNSDVALAASLGNKNVSQKYYVHTCQRVPGCSEVVLPTNDRIVSAPLMQYTGLACLIFLDTSREYMCFSARCKVLFRLFYLSVKFEINLTTYAAIWKRNFTLMDHLFIGLTV